MPGFDWIAALHAIHANEADARIVMPFVGRMTMAARGAQFGDSRAAPNYLQVRDVVTLGGGMILVGGEALWPE
jgi:uncharacterized membrane protein